MRLRSALLAAAILAPVLVAASGVESPADADPAIAVYVYSRSTSTERLTVGEVRGDDCDAPIDTPRFDGQIQPKQMLRIPIAGPCVCVSHTTEHGWSPQQRYCSVLPTTADGWGWRGGRGLRRGTPVGPTSFTIALDGQ